MFASVRVRPCVSKALNKLFLNVPKLQMWSVWKWPAAVHLCAPKAEALGLPVWDPVLDNRDHSALMPIITPAYPSANSSYNVSRSTLEVRPARNMCHSQCCLSLRECSWLCM